MNIITLTDGLGERGARPKPITVVVEAIDAMIPTQTGTTLYMRGGKHLHVKESVDVVRAEIKLTMDEADRRLLDMAKLAADA